MKYRVAETDEEYAACNKLLTSEGGNAQAMGFPTILAIDGETIVGFVATTPQSDMVLAGPLVVANIPGAPIVVAQLVRLYETSMQNMGITSFVFYTDENDQSAVGRAMAGMFKHIKPYAKVGTKLFYTWKVKEGRVA